LVAGFLPKYSMRRKVSGYHSGDKTVQS